MAVCRPAVVKTNTPFVYFVLGNAGSGRRQVLVDLISSGFADPNAVVAILPGSATASPADVALQRVERWDWCGGAIDAAVPAGVSTVFFVSCGAADPVEQVESFRDWLKTQAAVLARVLCVVDCRLAEQNPQLFVWFEACIHFSDVVLLNHREGVGNKWLSDFIGHFKNQYFPCLFELVKDGRVRNPALILEPEARRMSHVFDAEQEWVFTDAEGETVDEEEDAGDVGHAQEVEATPAVDPYLVRDAAGRRVKRLPDISKFLPPPATAG